LRRHLPRDLGETKLSPREAALLPPNVSCWVVQIPSFSLMFSKSVNGGVDAVLRVISRVSDFDWQ
jgi:hypothetical protein